jgi:ABC-type nickel/cobalt efflux system permease component RcnA
MSPDLGILLVAAASIGFIHTLTGPDHFLPFIVMGKARQWTTIKTLWITFLCGLGHVGSSIAIGAIGIALGIGVSRLETVESLRGDLAAWAFIIFGFGYFLWGLWKAYKGKAHKHFHLHMDNQEHVHMHEHRHIETGSHEHPHNTRKAINLTPWILFTVFVLGPCEPLIPLLMYPAAKFHMGAVLLVTAVFSVCTVVTMLAIVYLTLRGIRFLPLNTFERYMHAIAGATICLSGCAIVFLGL